MVITDIATYIREQTGVTVQNITDAQLYRYINISYHEIENAIVTNLNENFFWNEITASLVANQEEYSNDVGISGNISGTNKVIAVSIDYNGNGNFIDATYTSAEDMQDKRNNSSQSYPFYTIVDNSIFLFPKPIKAVTNGLKMRVVQNLIDLTSLTTEANIFNGKIHANNHYFIALGAFEHIYRQRQLENDAVNARRVFLSKLYGDGQQDIGLLGRLNNRNVSTMNSIQPNTNKFK